MPPSTVGHRSASVTTESGPWRYIASGAGADVVLLLPGALGTDAARALLDALAATHRVIAPVYGGSSTMRAICDALVRVLDAEGVERAHVVGASYGGVVAQCLAHDQPARTRGIVLSHSFVLRPEDAWRFRLAIRLWRRIPRRLLRSLLRRRLERLILEPLRAAGHADLPRWREHVVQAANNMLESGAASLQQRVLLDVAEHWPLGGQTSVALAHRMLIVQSDNDPAIRARARAALVAAYPGAAVHTFHGTGHVTSILAPAELASVLNAFFESC
ncbi:MAG: alpha/beta hydrolase [Gemmatimonadaceae bacterium]